MSSNKAIKPIISIIMIANMCLGTGPIIMPPVFLSGGVILSTVLLISIAFLSYIGCEFIMEAISISNALEILNPNIKQVKQQTIDEIQIQKDSKKINQKETQSKSNKNQNNAKQALPYLVTFDTLNAQSNNKLQKQQKSQNNLSSQDSLVDEDSQNSIKNSIFNIQKNFEFLDLGKQIMGNFGEKFLGIQAILNVYGAIVSYCIITGKTMSSVFQDVEILNNYYFWLGIFFVSSSVFSFKDVSNIKFIQKFIGIIRFITIMLFLITPVYLMFKNDKVYPLTNFTYDYQQNNGTIKQYDSIMSYVQPQLSIKKSMIISFVTCLLISIIIPYLAIMCFGGELTDPYDNWNIVFYTEMFKGKIDVVYYFTSFYLFLNVATIPVLTIVLRKNLLALLNYKENEEKITAKSFIANLFILLSILLCSAIFKDKIQLVLTLIFGIFGSWILIGIPSLLVIIGRKKIQKILENKDNLPNDKNTNNIHQPLITNKYFTYSMFIISIILFVYNTFLVIQNLIEIDIIQQK